MLTKYFAKLLTCVAPVLCALYLLLCPVPRPVPSSLPYPCALSCTPSCIPCVLCAAVFGSSGLRIERPPPFSGNTLSYAAAAVLPGVSSFSSAHNQPCPLSHSGRCQAKDKRRRNGRTPKQVLGAMFMFLLLLLLLLSFISFRFVTLPPPFPPFPLPVVVSF